MTLESYLLTLDIMHQALRCSWSDIRVCVNPGWHRREFYYAGNGIFHCAICERLEPFLQASLN